MDANRLGQLFEPDRIDLCPRLIRVRVDRVDIVWPDGERQSLTGLAARQTVLLRRGEPVQLNVSGTKAVMGR